MWPWTILNACDHIENRKDIQQFYFSIVKWLYNIAVTFFKLPLKTYFKKYKHNLLQNYKRSVMKKISLKVGYIIFSFLIFLVELFLRKTVQATYLLIMCQSITLQAYSIFYVFELGRCLFVNKYETVTFANHFVLICLKSLTYA